MILTSFDFVIDQNARPKQKLAIIFLFLSYTFFSVKIHIAVFLSQDITRTQYKLFHLIKLINLCVINYSPSERRRRPCPDDNRFVIATIVRFLSFTPSDESVMNNREIASAWKTIYGSSWSRNRSTDHAYTLEEDNAAREECTSTPDVVEPEESGRVHDDPQEDDPYEYDDDIRLPTTSGERRDSDDDDDDDDACLSLFEAANYLVSGSSVPTTRVSAPCWGCKGCAVEGLPLFLLGSPVAEASCTCTSCQ